MKIFFWEVKEIVKDFGCGICNILKSIGGGIVNIICVILEVIGYILYKVMRVVLAITSIFFLIGLFMFYQNIKEAINGVWFTETTRFVPMLYLCGCYFVAFFICKTLRAKY